MVSSLKAPLSDPDPQVRVNSYQALLGLSGNREGAAALVAADYLAVFMSKIEWEGVEVQALILETLRNCVGDMRGTTEALSHKAVEMCIKLLSSPSTPVKYVPAHSCMELWTSLLPMPSGRVQHLIHLAICLVFLISTGRRRRPP